MGHHAVEGDLKGKITHQIITFMKAEIVNDGSLELDEHDEIIAKGLIDSMGIVRLMAHMQTLYSIKEFDRSDLILDNFRTIGRIATMIRRYVQ